MAARPSVRSPCSSTTRASSAKVAAAAAASPALNAFVNVASRPAIAFSSLASLPVFVLAEGAFSCGADSWAPNRGKSRVKARPSTRQTDFIRVTPLRSRSEASTLLSWSVERD